MIEPANRRGFLSGLLSLPLIGGGVTLIGKPSAVAEPLSLDLMKTYVGWLGREFGRAHDDLLLMLPPDQQCYGGRPHPLFAPPSPIAGTVLCNWPAAPNAAALVVASPPATRAALVLSTIGVKWREGGR